MAQEWRAAITEPPSPRHRVLIAIEQAEENYVVGFAASGPADEAALAPEEKPLPDDVAAVTDFLVEPRWGRRGHGSRLLAATVDLWREDGFDDGGGLGLRAGRRDHEVPRRRPAGRPTARPARSTSTTCWCRSCACTPRWPADRGPRRGTAKRLVEQLFQADGQTRPGHARTAPPAARRA